MACFKLHLSFPAVTSLRMMLDTIFCSHELPPSLSEKLHDSPTSLSIREVASGKGVRMPAVMETCIALFLNVFRFSFECLQCTEFSEVT